MKTITSFAPATKHGMAESDRHYVDVHVPLARRWLSAVPWITQYMTYKPIDQRDANGSWARRPAVWRYAMQRFAPEAAGTTFPPEIYARLAPDNVNCVSRLRCFEVAEVVPFDRLSGQTALATYLIDVEGHGAHEVVVERLDALVACLVDRAGTLPGIRRVTFDRVERETEAEPLDEPGQRITDRFLDVTPKVGFVGVVADARPFGDALLADPAVDAALFALEQAAEVSCLAVHEECGFDRREA
jgi:hypothetical protein